MLILGHVGITFGVALAADSIANRTRSRVRTQNGSLPARLHSRVVSLAHHVDLRLLAVGSLLPDAIDKPVGLLLFPGYFGSGRLFAHSLLFVAVLGLAGLWRYRTRRATVLLVLAYGSFMHLVLDAMWRAPATLLWPFAGPLEKGAEAGGWLARIIETLLTNPAAYVPEIAGAILLAPLLVAVAGRVGLLRFLRTGRVD